MTIIPAADGGNISIWIDGRKLAMAKNCEIICRHETRLIGAYGSENPVGAVEGAKNYQIKLMRVSLCDSDMQDGISFDDLINFELIIEDPIKRAVYKSCRLSGTTFTAKPGEKICEQLTAVSFCREIFRMG